LALGTATPRGARAGAIADVPAANRTVALVAMAPDGELRALRARTNTRGTYSFSPSLDEPGYWRLETGWGGDHGHAGTPSRPCTTLVRAVTPPPPPPPPPPATSSLTLTCPSKDTVKAPLSVSGMLTPGFADAPVSVTYSYRDSQNNPQTITDHVTTDSSGNYSDSVTANSAGNWMTQASFAGDAGHTSSTSPQCTTTVEP
jgi:hypothetical protein